MQLAVVCLTSFEIKLITDADFSDYFFARMLTMGGSVSEHSIPIAIGEPLPACVRDPEFSPCESAEAGIRENRRIRLGSQKEIVDLKTRSIRVGDHKREVCGMGMDGNRS